ncbi:MAG: hypothetical protein M1527_05330, partial [Gammaproteobacteria bacterium]|nr:hypothetical protein [Gammaproteobacteria bacterium]
GTEYGPVQRTDTLWTLANRLRPDDSITTEQMMLALLKANPEAFLRKNINGLKSSYTLRIPDLKEIAALSQTEALREVKQQYARWNDIKSARAAAAAGTVPAATGAAETAQGSTDTGTGAAADDEHRLKLVAAGADQGSARTDKAPAAAGADIKQELAVATEALESSKLENEELRSRISDLEKQLETMQRMITLKDENLAAMQSKLGVEIPPVQTVTEEPAGGKSTTTPSASPEQAVEESAPEQTPIEPDVAAQDNAPAQPATPALGGLFDNLPRDPKALGMIGGTLLLVLALIWVVRRRREISSIITAQSGAHASPAAMPSTESAAQTETAQAASPGEETAAVSGTGDPIAEADVYIAYEQYPQAENILKRAIAGQPERNDLKLKLLELYHLTRNSSAFLVHAEELYTALGGTGADTWGKVAAMGKDLAPGDPLFGGGETFSTGSVSAPEIDVTLPAAPKADATLDFASREQAAAQPAGNALDFTLDFDTGTQSTDALDVQGVAEYNLADFQLDASAKPDQADEMEIDLAKLDLGGEPIHADTGPGPDFDLGAAATPQADAGTEPDIALGFDTDVTTTDEVATKLDLARAYIDMGDAEGARSILDEVEQEGNATQKKEAQELMRQIA